MNKIIVCILLIASLAACSSSNKMYSSQAEPGIDFNQYKTFAFLPTTDSSFAKIVNKQKLEHAMSKDAKSILQKKGMQLDTLHPDCFFQYLLVVKNEYSLSSNEHVLYSPQTYATTNLVPDDNIYFWGSNNKPATYYSKPQINVMDDGSLVVYMIDAKTNKTIWTSSMKAKINVKDMPPMDDAVHDITVNMFKHFPRK